MKQQGMTFLELVICISLLAIIGSSSVLRLGQSLRQQELESASLQLAGDLRWLQQLAINGGSQPQSYILLFKLDTPYGYHITGDSQVLKSITFPPSVRLFVGQHVIGFGLSGAPLKGAQTISLQSGTLDLWKYVILAPVTGRVRISNHIPHQGEE
jgi:prepilin-type N-terminal cleavage/methylation domain-containing protein